LRSSLGWRERVLVSWVGLRGAAPIVLATFPLLAGISKAGLMFDVVFFIVLTSALMQGTSIGWLSARLGLAQRSNQMPLDPLDLVSNGERDIVEFSIDAESAVAGKRIMDLDLPPNTLVLLVERAGTHIIPRGGTTVQPGDHLLVLAAKDQMPAVQRALP
jgi:cell volume regulation protein A